QKLSKLTGHSHLPMGPYAEDTAEPPPYLSASGGGKFEVTSTQGLPDDVSVDRVPALNVSTDAELTRERLVATWNENVPPVQRPHARLRLFVTPGLFVH